jgi:membrane protein DedA with SNARE-associated domain
MMAESILSFFSGIIIDVISAGDYAGIVFLMALQSANIPVPSEIIMSFSGFLAAQGSFNILLVVIMGVLGNIVGASVSFWMGFKGGRVFLEKYGKYFFLNTSDIIMAERWFSKYGTKTIFFSRIIPIFSTFISFPAGMFKMRFKDFLFMTAVGSLIWSSFLAWLGWRAGSEWEKIHVYFSKFSWIILGVIVVLGIWWIWRHFLKKSPNKI